MPETRAEAVMKETESSVDSQVVAALSLAREWEQVKSDSAMYWVEQAEFLIEKHQLNQYQAWANYHHGNALYLDQRGRKKEALPYLQQATQQFLDRASYIPAANALQRTGKTYLFLLETDSTEAYYQKALTLIRKHGDTEDKLKVYQLLIEFYTRLGEFERAKPLADSVEIYLSLVKSPSLQAMSHAVLGSLYMQQGKLGPAIVHFEDSRQFMDSLNQPLLLLGMLYNQGICYSLGGFVDTAVSCFLRCLQVAEQNQATSYVPLVKLHLSGLYFRSKRSDLSKKYQQEAIAAASQDVPEKYFMFLVEGMARALEQVDEMGYETFERMVKEKVPALGGPFALTYDYFQATASLRFQKDAATALASFQRIEQTPAERMFPTDEMLVAMAECHLILGNAQEVLAIATRLENEYVDDKSYELEKRLHMMRMQAYYQLDDPLKASNASDQYQIALQEELDVKHAISLQMAETSYRTDKIAAERDVQMQEAHLAQKQARQNLILATIVGLGLCLFAILALFLYRSRQQQKRLTNQVTQQRDRNETLLEAVTLERDRNETLLSEVTQERDRNETLLRELNHRVKNNLQQISGLLMLQGRQSPHQETKDALKVSQQRMETMSLLHTMLYQGEDVSEINLRDYLHTLTHNLLNAYGYPANKIDLHLSLSDLSVHVDQGIAIGLIANEWITNALKYAIPDSPYLHLSLQLIDPKTAELTVTDHGPGLPSDFDPMTASSYGLQLVQTMSEQMYGTVTVEGDKGTEWKIQFGLGD